MTAATRGLKSLDWRKKVQYSKEQFQITQQSRQCRPHCGDAAIPFQLGVKGLTKLKSTSWQFFIGGVWTLISHHVRVIWASPSY